MHSLDTKLINTLAFQQQNNLYHEYKNSNNKTNININFFFKKKEYKYLKSGILFAIDSILVRWSALRRESICFS
jgi:hypothetical protein